MLFALCQYLLRGFLLLVLVATGSAAVVYDFSLPANGDIDAVNIQVTVPSYLTGGLDVFFGSDPEAALFTSGSVPMDLLAFGMNAEPAATRVGVALLDTNGLFATLNRDFPDDFFVFNRLPDENGTFSSIGGTIEADPSYTLDTVNPTAQLIVSGAPIPEPNSIWGFGAGVGSLLWLHRVRRRERRN